jgi:F-type H+-transporting ATPase subunit delta
MTSVAASRYARALADVVTEPRAGVKPEDALAQLRSIETLIAESHELRLALSTPAVSAARKRAVIEKLGAQLNFSKVLRNFMFVILDHHRIALLTEIREAFELQLDERLGFTRADVSSAEPLDEKQTSVLSAELARLSGRQVRLRFNVDPDLIGGVVARVGSTVYDGSIRGQLDRMRRQFTAEAADYKVGI